MNKVFAGMLLVAIVVVAGCVTGTDTDTGQKTYGLDPCSVAKAEKVGLTIQVVGPPVVAGISAINSAVGAIAGAVFGIFGALLTGWKKWHEPLVAKTTAYNKLIVGARAAADALELGKGIPEFWNKAKPVLRAADKESVTMVNKV